MDAEREPEESGREPEAELDPGADTGRFQAFVAGEGESAGPGPAQRGGSATGFRLLTLVGGLVVFAGLVWLLLR